MTRVTDTNMPSEIWAGGQWPWTLPKTAIDPSSTLRAKHQPTGTPNPDSTAHGLGATIYAARYLAGQWPSESALGRSEGWIAARLTEIQHGVWPEKYWQAGTLVDVRGFGLMDVWAPTPEYYYTLPSPGPGPGQHSPGEAWTRIALRDTLNHRVGVSHRFALAHPLPCQGWPPIWLSITLDQTLSSSHRRTKWPLSLHMHITAGQSLNQVSQDWPGRLRTGSLLRCHGAPPNTALSGYLGQRHADYLIVPDLRRATSYCTPGAGHTHYRFDFLPTDPVSQYGGGNDWGEVSFGMHVSLRAAKSEPG